MAELGCTAGKRPTDRALLQRSRPGRDGGYRTMSLRSDGLAQTKLDFVEHFGARTRSAVRWRIGSTFSSIVLSE